MTQWGSWIFGGVLFLAAGTGGLTLNYRIGCFC